MNESTIIPNYQDKAEKNYHLAIKKISILENKLDILHKLKKQHQPQVVDAAKRLFHISLSFSIIMLLNKNTDLYHHHLSLSLRTVTRLMTEQQSQYDSGSPQHVLLFTLLGFVY